MHFPLKENSLSLVLYIRCHFSIYTLSIACFIFLKPVLRLGKWIDLSLAVSEIAIFFKGIWGGVCVQN